MYPDLHNVVRENIVIDCNTKSPLPIKNFRNRKEDIEKRDPIIRIPMITLNMIFLNLNKLYSSKTPQFNEEVQHLEKQPNSWYSGWIWEKDTGT